MADAKHIPGPIPCSYRPRNPSLKATFERLLRDGQSIHRGLADAYKQALDTGLMPAWCPPGSHSFAAAKAGLCAHRRAAIAKATGSAA